MIELGPTHPLGTLLAAQSQPGFYVRGGEGDVQRGIGGGGWGSGGRGGGVAGREA